VVLNITRKNREWRFYEFVGLRLEDLPKASAVVSDIRKILRQDPRVIQKLHRRVFLDKLTRDEATIYISFYVEAANRDAFMAGGCCVCRGGGTAAAAAAACMRAPPLAPFLFRVSGASREGSGGWGGVGLWQQPVVPRC
jgi:hypothetical protein